MNIIENNNGHIRIITINRPESHNALDIDTSKELAQSFIRFRDDPEVWVAILTGAGSKAFCAGGDLKKMGEYYGSMTPLERRQHGEINPGIGGITRNLPVWKPILAAINGHCLAGGLEIALTCDIRVAEPQATFGLTEAKWGIVPGAGGTQRLPRLIGTSRALEMIMTGSRISCEDAFKWGLINHMVQKGGAVSKAMEIAGKICKNGPLAVRAAKEAVIRGMDFSLEEGLRLEQFLAEPVRQSKDAKEGPAAFSQKREPDFQGK